MAASPVDLTGAGATFPYPLYSRWISDYSAQTGVRINYESVGSGAGIRRVSERAVDFGATDVPMSDEELKNVDGRLLHIPTVAGALAITYNLPGISSGLKLDGPLLADIYLGRVKSWNDRRITELNPGVQVPRQPIAVVHRNDASGATYVFTDYLSTVSQSWSGRIGRGREVRWQIGTGEGGNEGVAGRVKQVSGTIGYVELAYARQNRLPVAAIRNSMGAFVVPSNTSVAAAASGVTLQRSDPADFRVSIIDAKTPGAYPICSFSWILIYQDQTDPVKGKRLVDFLQWTLDNGAAQAAALEYAPLPPPLAEQVRKFLSSIRMERSRD